MANRPIPRIKNVTPKGTGVKKGKPVKVRAK